VKYWEIIADNLSKTGVGGCVSAVDSRGRTTFIEGRIALGKES
jgi:hypothetical protein